MVAQNPPGVVGPRGGTTHNPSLPPPTPPVNSSGGSSPVTGGAPSGPIPRRNLIIIGAVAVAGIGIILWRKHQAAAAAAANSNNAANTTTSTQGEAASPLPGSGVLQPIIVGQGSSSTSAGATPAYAEGQSTADGTIVSEVPTSDGGGYYYLTSTGDVLESGDAQPNQAGTTGESDYTQYVQKMFGGPTTPSGAAEVAGNGNFSQGGLALNPNGTYTETNNQGETYTF